MSQADLPDFEEMMYLAGEISGLLEKKLLLDLMIKNRESEIVLKVSNDEAFFQKGKPPSMSFIESTYMLTGLEGELITAREEYCKAVSQLENSRLRYDIMKMKVDVYRTESANQRMATL
jgi:hypothetical protein